MNKYHFENHITIMKDSSDIIDGLQYLAPELGFKVIHIAGNNLDDLMTSARYHGTKSDATNWHFNLIDELKTRGFNVLRHKLEVQADYADECDTDNNYYEAHVPVLVDSNSNYCRLQIICEYNVAHISRNLFKSVGTSAGIQMVTMRTFGSRSVFETNLAKLIKNLTEYGFNVDDKVEREYVLIDSNLDHDTPWTSSPN